MANTNAWMRPAAGIGAGVIVVAIAAILYVSRPLGEQGLGEVTPPAQNIAATPPQPASPAETSAPAADAAETPMQAQILPAFDLVRISPDGLATVAGRAEPGATVAILVDGTKIAQAVASSRGEFVALFDLPASGTPREMRLQAQAGETVSDSEESILIAPANAPPAIPVSVGDETDAAPDDVAPDDVAQGDATGPAMPGTARGTAADMAQQMLEASKVTEAPTVLMADDDGVKVLQQAGTTPSELRIDAVTYDPEGRVYVSGRSTPGTQLLIYLNEAFLTETVTGEDGQWRRELEDVAAGIYTLRVDQVDEAGAVISRAESPLQREEIAKLAQIAAQDSAAKQKPADEKLPSGTLNATGPVSAAETSAEEASTEAPEEVAAETSVEDTPKARIASVTVQPGNTLWGLASERYGDGYMYVRVFDANRGQIRNPDLIYPGQIFQLPE